MESDESEIARAAGLEPFIGAVRRALEPALRAPAAPPADRLGDLAACAVLAVLDECRRHPGVFPQPGPGVADDGPAGAAGISPGALVGVLAQLVTRREIAARRDVSIAAVSNWAAGYPDFPEPVLGKTTHVPYYWWPAVRDYLDRMQLPRSRQSPAAIGARDRDARALEALALFPDGLTTEEVAALSGEQDEGTTPNAVQVRYDDRLHRLEAAGVVSRTRRPGDRRNVWAWVLSAPGDPARPLDPARLGFPATPRVTAPTSRPRRTADHHPPAPPRSARAAE